MPLVLRARLAWAHDWVSNPALGATFESLPGSASFTVFGAPIPSDSAHTSAGAQLFFTPNWSFLVKFDGEFASDQIKIRRLQESCSLKSSDQLSPRGAPHTRGFFLFRKTGSKRQR